MLDHRARAERPDTAPSGSLHVVRPFLAALSPTCSNMKAIPNPSVPGMRSTLTYMLFSKNADSHRALDSCRWGDGEPNIWYGRPTKKPTYSERGHQRRSGVIEGSYSSLRFGRRGYSMHKRSVTKSRQKRIYAFVRFGCRF